MSVGYFVSSLSDLGLVVEVLKNHSLSKLIVHVTGNVNGVPYISDAICSQICKLYGETALMRPQADIRINVQALKFLRQVQQETNPDIYFMADEGVQCGGTGRLIFKRRTSINSGTAKPLTLVPNVVLGGTFDRLHAGHKILLTEAVMRCSEKLTIGVTDTSMIKNKKLWELIEPVEKRMENLLNFLKDVDRSILYEIVPISDMFGPTKSDPNLNLIVVSAETKAGGDKVNEVRIMNGLSPLTVYVVNLLEFKGQLEGDESKVSSSNGRFRLLGTRLQPPVLKPNLPTAPYLIGLTGGIASGKSNVGRMLAKRGAGLVDCDKIGHSIYRRGSDTYYSIIEVFGTDVVGEDGEINRKALGSIVFSSKEELEKLNRLTWPHILKASIEEANRLYKEENKAIVILEAAVLLRAGWNNSVHEVWCCIVPPEEAIKRVMERNNLSQEAATVRVNAQPTNSQQVAISNVVFSTILSYEFTESQTEKAWNDMQEYLRQKISNKL